ncbi:STM4015 family protein [Streptomyces roseicoloratus]|uniref:STM4015 family protein n=1 Tax=Streptomyces roseicoloratus TaxID=2508722 RepID=A0ABY9RS93_9ACTN|nr:STM4015 family protein [Streptomyces roseicoloratus]WMX44114.1 STM4015 family protein [Streptomyces roseicoloratus]
MTIGNYLRVFHDLPVFEFPTPATSAELPDAASVAWRLSAVTYRDSGDEEEWTEIFERFLDAVDTSRVRALVVGGWEDAYEESSDPIVEALVAAADRLSALEAVFLGDMLSEDCEISWITQGDVTPLLAAYPRLASLGVRGATGLEFPPLRHEGLRRLVVQTGGLPGGLVRDIGACDLPALEHLELWLGTTWYGGDSTPEDLEPILSGTRLPALRSLALCNSVTQDAVVEAVAGAPVVARLSELDLSMGTLTDAGAEALLAGQPLTHLKRLDLAYHYLSEEMSERIVDALAPHGVDVDVTDRQEPDVYDGVANRYTAVGE